MEDKTYIVPPKLNQKLTFFGFQALEAIILSTLILLLIFLQSFLLMLITAILFVLWIRPDKEHNALGKIIALWCYYSKPQIFTAKGVKMWNERG